MKNIIINTMEVFSERNEITECPICFESLTTDNIDIAVTSCQHTFHISCLITWLENSMSGFRCPSCNQSDVQIDSIYSNEVKSILSPKVITAPQTIVRQVYKIRPKSYRYEIDEKRCCVIL